jgi:uncharacterized protein (DUF305 family)
VLTALTVALEQHLKRDKKMHAITSAALAALLIVGGVSATSAQDAMAGHDMSTMGQSALPDICVTDAGTAAASQMPGMGMGHSMNMDEGHTALMMGMDAMNKDMMVGSMATDLDVAFACSMIPHHRGAIAMAEAELRYGDDPKMKELAQTIIDDQTREIADIISWLEQQQ